MTNPTPTSGAADLPEALRRVTTLSALKALVKAEERIENSSSFSNYYSQESMKFQLHDAMRAARAAIKKAEPLHDSDCSLHNEPAYPAGPCDCSVSLTAQAISAESAGAGYAALPEVNYEGGRESVDDALAIVESFGPGIGGLNDTYARQVLLAAEVTRLRGIYKSAVAGRTSMRDALRASHGQAPAQQADPSITLDFKQASELLEMFGGEAGLMTLQRGGAKCHSGPGLYAWYSDVPEEGAEFLGTEPDDEASPQAAQQAPAGATSPWSRALEIRIAQGWKLNGDRLPVLYTDTINDEGVCRDDLWLCTTSALAATAAPSTAASGGWMPIETAPKDSTARLVWCTERKNIYCVTWLKNHRWVLFGGPVLTEEPTHWMPLPASPTIEGESNG